MNYLATKTRAVLKMIFAKNLSDEDVGFVTAHLNKQEQILFYRMSIIDQKHSLAVAGAVKDLIGRRSRINLDKMMKTALLHDIGKANIKLSLGNRVKQTIMFFLFKPLAEMLAEKGKDAKASKFRKMLYNYKQHGMIGADLLRELGTDENIAYLIENHHTETSINEPIELSVLREADSLN